MSDLECFIRMLLKGGQDYHRDAFCGTIRLTVVVPKFSSWFNTIHGVSKGIPYNVIYIFTPEGDFVSSVINLAADLSLVY